MTFIRTYRGYSIYQKEDGFYIKELMVTCAGSQDCQAYIDEFLSR